MGIRELVSDVGVGMIGGYVGTKEMEPVSMKLYELESEEDRRKPNDRPDGETSSLVADVAEHEPTIK